MQKFKFTVDPLNSDHRSPLGSTHEAIAFSHESLSLLLILSTLIIDPPQSTKEAITSTVLIVDPPPGRHCRSTPLHFESLIYRYIVNM